MSYGGCVFYHKLNKGERDLCHLRLQVDGIAMQGAQLVNLIVPMYYQGLNGGSAVEARLSPNDACV
jgi:hypothetical protein